MGIGPDRRGNSNASPLKDIAPPGTVMTNSGRCGRNDVRLHIWNKCRPSVYCRRLDLLAYQYLLVVGDGSKVDRIGTVAHRADPQRFCEMTLLSRTIHPTWRRSATSLHLMYKRRTSLYGRQSGAHSGKLVDPCQCHHAQLHLPASRIIPEFMIRAKVLFDRPENRLFWPTAERSFANNWRFLQPDRAPLYTCWFWFDEQLNLRNIGCHPVGRLHPGGIGVTSPEDRHFVSLHQVIWGSMSFCLCALCCRS